MVRRCPVCGTPESEKLMHIEMEIPDNVCLPKNYDVVACNKCGFAYAKLEGVTQKNYNEYYSKNNDYSDEKIRIKFNKELDLARMELIKKHISTDAKILDIGCGNGDFLVELKKNGYNNIKGIDPSENSVEVVKERGIDAEIGNIFDIQAEDEKYDVVCCNAVLEHIYDLKGCIEKLKGRLKGVGAKIFVDVPGMEGINEYLAMPAENFNCEHINYFTFQSLDNLFCINGFKRISNKEDYYLFLKNASLLDIGAIYELKELVIENWKKDEESARAILQYFSTIEKQMIPQIESLRKELMKEERVVIWGGGNYAFQMLSLLPEIKKKINYFIDSNCNKLGRKIAGKEIRSIEEMPEDDTLVVICSMNYAEEMAAECEKKGVRYYIY